MKSVFLSLLFVSLFAVIYTSCLEDTCKSSKTYIKYEPIYKTSAEIRNLEIKLSNSRTLKNPGKIYSYGDYLLINEIEEGIHVINNANPNNPINLGFIEIPGNVDMAIRDNILFADNYIDLLAIDISNVQQPILTKRREEVFTSIGRDADKGFLVDYKQSKVSYPCDAPESFNEGGIYYYAENLDLKNNGVGVGIAVPTTSITGIGGSMARFTVADSYLYTVDNSSLKVFDVTVPSVPVHLGNQQVGWGIETIFPYKDKLFIGSNTGMFIFSLTNPKAPSLLSTFTHARACDPVFATENRAYITLRSGTTCTRASNQLDVIDISSITDPKLIKSYPMYNPKGLSVSENSLFLCDEGFKVFDIKDDYRIDDNKLAHLKNFDTYDVIYLDGIKTGIIVGKDGLYQYDLSDRAKPNLRSKIPVSR